MHSFATSLHPEQCQFTPWMQFDKFCKQRQVVMSNSPGDYWQRCRSGVHDER